MSSNIDYKTVVIAILCSVILSTGIVITVPQVQEILRGHQGEQGIKGIQGEEGIQGIQGEQGVQGWPGQSIIGPVGVQGEQGLQGLLGLQGEQGLQGIQGPQGEQGGPFPYDGEWVLINDWNWLDTVLDYWTYTFTTEADFILITSYYHYVGDKPELAYMYLGVHEGRYTTGEPLLRWTGSWTYGGTSLMVIGKGTYTIEADTNYYTDTWIWLWEFIPT